MRRKVELRVITEAIQALIPGAVPASLTVRVTETLPGTVGHDGDAHKHTWSGTPEGLAERILTAWYGRPGATAQTAFLVQGGAAQRARDLGADVGVLMGVFDQLMSAPWYPVRPGDLVHVHYDRERAGQMPTPAFGETYVISDAGKPGDAVGGLLDMQLLAHTLPDTVDGAEGMTGRFAVEAADDPVYQLWFDVGPHLLTIVRDGQVVHGGGAK